MKNILLCLMASACAVPFVVAADPPTPPQHAERDYVSIGGGLFLRADDDITADDDGNVGVNIYSRDGVNAGSSYSLDILSAETSDEDSSEITVIAGTLGNLRMQSVTIDCTHRTYEVIDTRYAIPREVWRLEKTLPALQPLFRFACKKIAAQEREKSEAEEAERKELVRQSSTPTIPASQPTLSDEDRYAQSQADQLRACIQSPEMAHVGNAYGKCLTKLGLSK